MRAVEDRVAGQAVVGAIDVPGSPVAADRLAVRGWALGKDSPVARVEVWLDGRAVGRAGLGRPRPDLIGVVGNGDAEMSGFELRLDSGRLGRAPGAIDVAVRVTLLDGTGANLAPVTIPVAATLPGAPSRVRLKRVRTGRRRRQSRGGRIRLLCFARSLDLGGSQLRLSELLRHLAATGEFDATVIAPGDGPLRRELETAGALVHLEPTPIHDISAYEDSLARLRPRAEGRFDLVLASTLTSFPGVDLADRLELPSVWRIGEIEALSTVVDWLGGDLDAAVEARARRAFGAASAVVFNSESALARHERRAGPGRFAVLGTGTDVAVARAYARATDREACRRSLGVPPGTRLLVCAGTRWPIKGQSLLVSALERLRADHAHLECVLIGQPTEPYARALSCFIRRHRLAGSVRVLPFATDLRPWWRAADAAVSPSESESMPASVLEAMAFGVPVLASRVGGVPEVVEDGGTGWLVEPNDLRALIAGLERVATAEPGELRSLGERAARKVAREHDRPDALARMTALLRQVAGP